MKNNSNSSSRISRLLIQLFNLRAWCDWDRMKRFTFYLVDGIKKFFVPQPMMATESFAAAMKRLNLTEEDIIARKKGLLRVAILMLLFALGLFCYAIYHLIYLNVLGFILSLVVMGISLVLAFRYHFWYFQMKEQKLGCSVHVWFRQGIMGDKQ